MKINDDRSLAGMIPIAIACAVAISYSWTKWQRGPEDSQSVAFVGLDRKRRWATYRSLLRGSRIDDPVVLTIVETIHRRLRRSVMVVVAAMEAVTIATIALVIRAVLQQAFIAVDENGAEATAATAVIMTKGAAPKPEEPMVFNADHPFLFFIRHPATGTVLFVGRVSDPTR